MYEVAINLDDSEIDQRILNNPSIEWRLDEGAWGTWEETKAAILMLSGDASGVKTYAPLEIANEFTSDKTHTVGWRWIMDNNNNVMDTEMGNEAVAGDIEAKIAIKVTATQVNVDTTGMLDGNGQTFNISAPVALTFRSAAPLSELQAVKVGDDELERNVEYTATEGSTVVTINADYLATLNEGNYTVSIVSDNMTANATFSVANKTLATDENGNYLVSSAADLFILSDLVNSGANNFNNKTILMTTDINLENRAFTPIGHPVDGVGNDSWDDTVAFLGTFNGQGHTIYNLNVTATDYETNRNSAAGLFGGVRGGTIKNLNVDTATITGHHFAGVIAGTVATSRYAYIENCHVTNATVTSTYYDEDNSGDKAGVIAGTTGSNYITNCSATNSTVTAGRDAGQIVGAADASKVTGCNVTNVTVTWDGVGANTNIRNELVGREF
jgi:hypothetical protein